MVRFVSLSGLLLTSFMTYADTCGKDNYTSQLLKQDAMTASELILKDFGDNSESLLKQYEKLNSNLKSVRKLADISENSLRHCAGNGYIKEIYYLKNKKMVLMTNVGLAGFQTFYDHYVIPNETWTEAANALESDIIKKQADIKVALRASVSKQLEQEKTRKKELEAEAQELQELQALVNSAIEARNRNEQIQAQNNQVQRSIKNVQEQTAHSAGNSLSNTTVRSSYNEGQSEAYIANNSLFCLNERQFDYQFKLLAQGIAKAADGCYATAYDVDVIILDYGLLNGKSKVRAVSDETIMWVASESIERR